MRLHIQDNNVWRTGGDDRRDQSCYFTDEELASIYSDSGSDFWLACAWALEALLANSKAMLSAVKEGKWGENYADATKRIQVMVAKYKARSVAYEPTGVILETAYSQKSVEEYAGRQESETTEDYEDATDWDAI
jgi:hypothetical protein